MSNATKISTRRDILGASALRPDGAAKVSGKFEFSSDLHAEHMLWGATLRSPHPFARIISIDFSAAYKIAGVEAIITLANQLPLWLLTILKLVVERLQQ